MFASAVIITANGVNLAMDYVYIGVRKISRFLGLIMKFGRRPQNEAPVLDATIVLGDEAISGVSNRLEEICRSAGVEEGVSVRSAIATEEMAVYSRNHVSHPTPKGGGFQ